ncbi:hypothetical protein BDK51DRAFT_27124 [Blyttiomyces helicus]|uniref:Uncharacterized protein n=1 Tax=Blyttiomyces helicus TaxID=388810 RepID=A0A4P9WH59_9FUNG|nr:hypothetical protein BDK51DRAFT_27124 [Blyttiomyces helicus]|eukprot:RKO91275.1 hypothetical protein BDK51DRAFT_27124 [Blyttiomyces helicus]
MFSEPLNLAARITGTLQSQKNVYETRKDVTKKTYQMEALVIWEITRVPLRDLAGLTPSPKHWIRRHKAANAWKMDLGPVNDTNSGNSTDLGDDITPLITDTKYYNWILWGPFFLIPAVIIAGSDPLAELGLTLNRGYKNTSDIRKIRKAQEKKDKRARERLGTFSRSTSTRFTPLSLAQSYVQDISRRTRRTWSARLSPEAVRRWFAGNRYARMWMVFQVLCTVLAIVNYVLLTYQVGRADRKLIKYVDLFLATMFLIDYSLSMYTAEDRLRYYFDPSSLIDLVSIIPPFVYVIISETSQLLSFSETEEKRELTILALSFTNFVFLSASIINALESINAGKKDDPTLLHWHDSLYYIMVTFSTIGFGDLTPSSIPSRILVMLLIIVVIVFVPIQTGKLAEIYNSSSPYQRAKYNPSSKHSHVVLSGTVTYSAVIDFCREYFESDPDGHVVILDQCEPSLDMRRLLRHPFYRNRVVYLWGTPLSVPDLRRASVMYATAIFLLNVDDLDSSDALAPGREGEQLRVTRGADAQILMQALVAKKAFPGLPVFGEVHDIRSQDLSAACGCDRVLCLDEIKMSILARNCIVPGILTLLLNLVHTYKDTGADSDHDAWLQEYSHGAKNHIFSFKFPAGLIGVRFSNVVALNPGRNYRIRDDDIGFCTNDGGDETMLRIGIHYRESTLREDLEKGELEKELDKVVNHDELAGASLVKTSANLGSSLLLSTSTSPVHLMSISGGSLSPTHAGGGTLAVPSDLSSHIILCGTMTSRGIRQFVRSIRSSATDFGEAPGSADQTPIVCLLESMPDVDNDEIWFDIMRHSHVHIVRGTPLKKTSLLQAGIQRCSRMVVFSKGLKGAGNNAQDLPDANSLFIVKMIQKDWPHVRFIVELVNGSNVKFFASKEAEWDTDNLRIQSVLNNYALSVSDRVALYKKFRTEGAERHSSFLYRLIKFTTSQPDSVEPAKNSSISRTVDSGPLEPRSDNFDSITKDPEFGDAPEPRVPSVDASDYLLSDENLAEDSSQQRSPSTEGDTSITSAYLQRLVEEAELNETGFSPFPAYHFNRHFAAGMVTTSCFMHSLLCQSYFRPYIIDVVRAFAGAVVHLRVGDSLTGKSYGAVVSRCLERGYVPLGLYRGVPRAVKIVGGVEVEGKQHNGLPKDDRVWKEDKIFAIKEQQ